jgi:hypothetical protein
MSFNFLLLFGRGRVGQGGKLCGWQRKGVVPREYTAPDGCAQCVKMSGDEGVSRKECGRRGAGREGGASDYTGILVGHVRTSLLRQSRTTKERDATGHMMLTRLAGSATTQ